MWRRSFPSPHRAAASKPSGNTNKEFNSIKDDAGLSGWPFADSSDASDYDAVWTAAAKMCRPSGHPRLGQAHRRARSRGGRQVRRCGTLLYTARIIYA
ncbi:hypothetical protein MRX96_034101 [Rhipicephalus microplus]